MSDTEKIRGQLDVYEVLEDVAENGLGVDVDAQGKKQSVKLSVAQIVARKLKGLTE